LKIKKEYILGIAGVFTLILFIWGINYLKGKDLLMSQQRFYAIYPKVDGLIESHPVTINGVKIGQVNRIGLHPDRSGRVLIECIVGNQADIPVNSTAVLAPAGFLGGYQIMLVPGSASVLMQNKDTLASEIQTSLPDEIGQQIMPLKAQVEGIFSRVDTLIGALNLLLDLQHRNQVSQGLESLNQALGNLEAITRNIQEQETSITALIQNMSVFSDTLTGLDLAQTLEQANVSLNAFTQLIDTANQPDGTIGLLLHDEKLYHNLETTAMQLNLLLEDIRNNPKKYVSFSIFGK
jgi:phospholipid/cholesterol/gamma-HCH transport system substrate-binding protein